MAFSWTLSFENVPQQLTSFLLDLTSTKVAILLLINVVLLFVGIFMDITPAVLIFTPIFLPVVMELGVDPIHFGVILVLNLCIGLCTPPVRVCAVCGSCGCQAIHPYDQPVFDLSICCHDRGVIDCDLLA